MSYQVSPSLEKQQLISFFVAKSLSPEDATQLTNECTQLLLDNSAQELFDGILQLFTEMTFLSSNYLSFHTCIVAYSSFLNTYHRPPSTEVDYTTACNIAHGCVL